MTKLVSVRVTMAVDDAVDLKDLKPAIADALQKVGTISMGGDDGPPGRAHFGTVEVLQGPDRANVSSTRRTGGKRATTTQQEMLSP